MYFLFPFSLIFKINKINNVIGWQQFYALNLAFFCNMFNIKKDIKIYPVNFTYKDKKGLSGKIYFNYMKGIVKSNYIKKIFVLSEEYAKKCADTFDVDLNKFGVIPFGVPDLYSLYKNSVKPLSYDYVLAIGRSNRDYDWLIEEWNDIDDNLVIICDTYIPKVKLPKNVFILSNVSGDAQFPYIMNCKYSIIPIDDGSICSGDTVILNTMAFKKTIIVTEPSTLSEMYIKNGINGYCVSKNKGQLKKLVNNLKLLDNKARKSYLDNFSRFSMGYKIGKLLTEVNNYEKS